MPTSGTLFSSAIVVRIRVEVEEDGNTRSIYKHVSSGGSFGANPLRQAIGLGRAQRIKSLEVFWPKTNQTQKLADVGMNEIYQITEGNNQMRRLELKRFMLTSF